MCVCVWPCVVVRVFCGMSSAILLNPLLTRAWLQKAQARLRKFHTRDCASDEEWVEVHPISRLACWGASVSVSGSSNGDVSAESTGAFSSGTSSQQRSASLHQAAVRNPKSATVTKNTTTIVWISTTEWVAESSIGGEGGNVISNREEFRKSIWQR